MKKKDTIPAYLHIFTLYNMMNLYVREELVYATNDWYDHVGLIKPGNGVIVVKEGHPFNNVGGGVITIDSRTNTVTMVLNAINENREHRRTIGKERFCVLHVVRHNLDEFRMTDRAI